MPEMNPKAHNPTVYLLPAPTRWRSPKRWCAQSARKSQPRAAGCHSTAIWNCALYAPGLGYYSGGACKFGLRGDDGSDFVTAPEMTPLFAATLARPVARRLHGSGTRDLMEFGAGTGKLAAGLLNALRRALGVAFDSYSIVDLSGELRERQRATIEADAPELASKVQWLERFAGAIRRRGDRQRSARRHAGAPGRAQTAARGTSAACCGLNERFTFDDNPSGVTTRCCATIDAAI